MLNKRLKQISEWLFDDANVLDIGCDHALLEIYIKKNRPNISIIGSDIHEGPLEKARENISKYGLTGQIELRIADGMDSYTEDIDTIVISGMGEETISSILEKGKDKLKHIKQIILSPNNDFFLLREKVTSYGFFIDNETIVCERGKYYLVISFLPGKKKYSKKELFFGPILLKRRDEVFLTYYKELKKQYENLLEQIPSSKKEVRSDIIKELKKINSLWN